LDFFFCGFEIIIWDFMPLADKPSSNWRIASVVFPRWRRFDVSDRCWLWKWFCTCRDSPGGSLHFCQLFQQ